jgi:hypothetical protein
MPRFLPMLVAALAAMPLRSDVHRTPVPTPLEVDELGLPILEVTLHTRANPDVTRTFRFILDTGAGITVVDSRLPPAFFWEDPESRGLLTDALGQSAEAPQVFLKRLEAGPILQENVHAVVQDLQKLMGRFEDRPVDGILGLDVLDHTRFALDMKARTVTWWAAPSAGMVELKGGRGSDGRVYVLLDAGKGETPVLVDTGLGGGFSLPASQAPAGEGVPTGSEGLFGGSLGSRELRVPRLAASNIAWLDVPVAFEPNAPAGAIGEDVLSSGPVWFDLIGSPRVRLLPDAAGNLPFDRAPSRRLPITWEGAGAARRLRVIRVRPDSVLAKAGVREGDVVLRADSLKGAALTHRTLQDLVASGKAHTWTVLRDGKEQDLVFAGRGTGLPARP